MNSTGEIVLQNATSSIDTNSQLQIVKLCVYLLILLCSAFGNTLVILSVAFFKRMKTVPNMFVANLAACDLITTVSSIPFDLAAEELGYWPYGAVMCKLLWPLATLTTIAGVLTLLAISADRYMALIYPLKMGYRVTKKRFYIIMVVIYISATWAILPYIIFQQYMSGDGKGAVPVCSELWPDLKYRKAYTAFLFCLQYGIPLPIMAFIYIRLGIVLYKNTKKVNAFSGQRGAKARPKKYMRTESSSSGGSIDSRTRSLRRRRQQNQKTVKMFLFIVLIFLIFMLPNQILWLLYDFGNSEYLLLHFDLIAFICRAFTYTNSVLNAAIYGAYNGSFRNAFVSTLKCQCGKRHQRQLQRLVSTYPRDRYSNGKPSPRNGNASSKYGNCYSKDDTVETIDSVVMKKSLNESPSPSKKTVGFVFPTHHHHQQSHEKQPPADYLEKNSDNNNGEIVVCANTYGQSYVDCAKQSEQALLPDIAGDVADAQDLLHRINMDMEYQSNTSSEDAGTISNDDARETVL